MKKNDSNKSRFNLTFAAVAMMVLIVAISGLTAPRRPRSEVTETKENTHSKAVRYFDKRLDSLIRADFPGASIADKGRVEAFEAESPEMLANRIETYGILLENMPEGDTFAKSADSLRRELRRLIELYENGGSAKVDYYRLVRIDGADGYRRNIRQHVTDELDGYWDKVVYDAAKVSHEEDSARAESVRRVREMLEKEN